MRIMMEKFYCRSELILNQTSQVIDTSHVTTENENMLIPTCIIIHQVVGYLQNTNFILKKEIKSFVLIPLNIGGFFSKAQILAIDT